MALEMGNEIMKTVLVDTTIQIERLKDRKAKSRIELSLKQFGFTSTSSYARLEFKRSWNLGYIGAH